MEKLLGILPYIYFEKPIHLGDVTLVSVPDWQGRDHAPQADTDRQYLQELSACFSTTRGLSTDKGAIKAITYFLLDSKNTTEKESLEIAHKAVTLLRYALLRPDNQALGNIESTYIYAFALPPVGGDEYHTYQGWVNFNQEIWVSPRHQKFPLPGWEVDFDFVHSPGLDDIEQIEERFYIQKMSGQVEAKVLLAMEWYNQSFQKYSVRNIAGHLVDVATAFETLFQLPRSRKTEEFKKQIRQYLGLPERSPMDHWAESFYRHVRSETVHAGKPLSLVFTHPNAQLPHLSFLWSAQRIFRECVAAKTGIPRHVPNHRLIAELTPNEIHLTKLRQAGNLDNIRENGLLEEVGKLRSIYPPGKREDIIWLGKELLGAYKRQFMPNEEQSLPTLNWILQARNDNMELGLKYHQFLQEFTPIYFRHIGTSWGEAGEQEGKKPKPISLDNFEQRRLESAIYHFAGFAVWALLSPP